MYAPQVLKENNTYKGIWHRTQKIGTMLVKYAINRINTKKDLIGTFRKCTLITEKK